STSHGTGGQSSTGTNAGGADASDDGLFTDHGPLVSIAGDPPPATIDILHGALQTHQVTAIPPLHDTPMAMVDADWSFDHPAVGLISPAGGLFTPSGTVGGLGTVTATVAGLSATASVTVTLHLVQNPGNVDPSTQILFNTPDNTPSGTL